jgi:hypothetical protein
LINAFALRNTQLDGPTALQSYASHRPLLNAECRADIMDRPAADHVLRGQRVSITGPGNADRTFNSLGGGGASHSCATLIFSIAVQND